LNQLNATHYSDINKQPLVGALLGSPTRYAREAGRFVEPESPIINKDGNKGQTIFHKVSQFDLITLAEIAHARHAVDSAAGYYLR